MKLEETKMILTILKTNYPQTYKGWTSAQSREYLALWSEAFKDDPVELVVMAVKEIIYSSTREFAPNIGQVKSMMLKLSSMKNELISEQEAWSLVYKALENSGYHAQEEFDKLPPVVKKIVGSANVLKEWCMMDYQQLNTVVASNFQRSYRARMKYEEEYNALSNNAKQLIGATYPQNKIETEDM